MATLVVECRGGKWQDDFAPLIPRMGRYFGAIHRHPRDREDRIQESIALLACDFSRKWQPGETITLQMRFTSVDVMQGKQAATGKGRGRKLVTQSNKEKLLARTRQRIERMEAEIDFRLALAEVADYQRQIVLLLMEGHSKSDIRRITGSCYRTIHHAIQTVLDLL